MSKKRIEKPNWQERLQTFVSGNLNRKSNLVVNDVTIATQAELRSIDYDPEGKGNDIIISLEGCGHNIDSPEEMTLLQKENGEVEALEIRDQGGATHFLKFE